MRLILGRFGRKVGALCYARRQGDGASFANGIEVGEHGRGFVVEDGSGRWETSVAKDEGIQDQDEDVIERWGEGLGRNLRRRGIAGWRAVEEMG